MALAVGLVRLVVFHYAAAGRLGAGADAGGQPPQGHGPTGGGGDPGMGGMHVENYSGHMNLTTYVAWDVFQGQDDAKQLISGRLRLKLLYDYRVHHVLSDPIRSVDVANFITGDRRDSATARLTRDGSMFAGSSSTFVGEFKQAFDRTCYPFDEETVVFDIVISHPSDMVFDLRLACDDGGRVPAEASRCRQPVQRAAIGFSWDSFECAASSDRWAIRCSMSGTRDWFAVLVRYVLPSGIFSGMGFASFMLPIELAMPRVAITMLALVSLNVLRENLNDQFPLSGTISWLEGYMLLSVTFMFVNLCGHIASLHFFHKRRLRLSRYLNCVSLVVVLPLFFAADFMSLYQRHCGASVEVFSAVMFAISALFCVAGLIYSARLYMADARQDKKRHDKKKDEPQRFDEDEDARAQKMSAEPDP